MTAVENETSDLTFTYGERPEEVSDREVKGKASPRAEKLIQDYYNAKLMLDCTFPIEYTKAWEAAKGNHPVLRRGLAFKAAFSALEPNIRPGELIVMSRNRYVRGASLVPWTANSAILQEEERAQRLSGRASNKALEDVTILATGGGVVAEDTEDLISISKRYGLPREEYEGMLEACKYWENTSVEETSWMWGKMHPEYDTLVKFKDAVLMSSDMEYGNRHGRSVNSYAVVFTLGFEGMKKRCRELIEENCHDGKNVDKVAFWLGTIATIEGVQTWMRKYVAEARRLADAESNPQQKQEYLDIADRLEWVVENPPRTFMEAVQLHWTAQLEVYNEMQGSGFSPGRLGAVLYPYWKKDIDEGRITRDFTLEVLECMRVKYTELEIATSTATTGILAGNTFNNICLGGQNPDGTAGDNELEMLFLQACINMPTVSPTLTVLYDGKLSNAFLNKAIECNKTGAGMPAWVNNRVGIEYCMKYFQDEHITIEDARSWSVGGCLEIQPGAIAYGKVGAGAYSSSGINFINVPKILELVLFDGKDPRTGIQVFPEKHLPLDTFDQVMDEFKEKFFEVTRIFQELYNFKTKSAFEIDQPILFSALTSDCLEKGADIDHEGNRYNRCFTTWITGQVNAANSLASLKKNVYEDHAFTLDDLKDAMLNNFGYESALITGNFSMMEQEKKESNPDWERIHALCMRAPKFGNDDHYVDDIYVQVSHTFRDAAESTTDVFGRKWVGSMLSTSTHGPLGQADIASPDGRLAGVTLADGGQSPYPGTDLNGPYAVLNSAVSIDHSDFKNTQLNMKVHPASIKGAQGSKKMLQMIKAFMDQGGYHIQFNVVDSRMLKDAQKKPDQYRNLLVRVAGFTQYWVEVAKPIQDELIARTEYEEI
ncbi:MAG: hypothetical protein MSC53_07430 [Arcanobacterium sp.]|nr:hypothetical protein [Arcanobacterium sp.]MDY5272560.1 pyruvate formate lyase family protein [Arcanobacterium sp.]